MTAKQKIERIKELLEDADFGEVIRDDFDRELFDKTIDEIEETVWSYYLFMCEIDEIIKM